MQQVMRCLKPVLTRKGTVLSCVAESDFKVLPVQRIPKISVQDYYKCNFLRKRWKMLSFLPGKVLVD